MDSKQILTFLHQVAVNNNRPWFMEHKDEYEAARAEFERGVGQALSQIVKFDAANTPELISKAKDSHLL